MRTLHVPLSSLRRFLYVKVLTRVFFCGLQNLLMFRMLHTGICYIQTYRQIDSFVWFRGKTNYRQHSLVLMWCISTEIYTSHSTLISIKKNFFQNFGLRSRSQGHRLNQLFLQIFFTGQNAWYTLSKMYLQPFGILFPCTNLEITDKLQKHEHLLAVCNK